MLSIEKLLNLCSIKVWNLADPLIKQAIAKSYVEPADETLRAAFVPRIQQIPMFSTTQVHHDYIDTVKVYFASVFLAMLL
jgi:hypothetical protein